MKNQIIIFNPYKISNLYKLFFNYSILSSHYGKAHLLNKILNEKLFYKFCIRNIEKKS